MTTDVYVRTYEDGNTDISGEPTWAIEVSIQKEYHEREIFAIHGNIKPEWVQDDALFHARSTWRMVNPEYGVIFQYSPANDTLNRRVEAPVVDPGQTTTF